LRRPFPGSSIAADSKIQNRPLKGNRNQKGVLWIHGDGRILERRRRARRNVITKRGQGEKGEDRRLCKASTRVLGHHIPGIDARRNTC